MEQKTPSRTYRETVPYVYIMPRQSTNIHFLLLISTGLSDPTEESSLLCHLRSTWFNKAAESQLFGFPESFASDFEAKQVLAKRQRTDSTGSEVT